MSQDLNVYSKIYNVAINYDRNMSLKYVKAIQYAINILRNKNETVNELSYNIISHMAYESLNINDIFMYHKLKHCNMCVVYD